MRSAFTARDSTRADLSMLAEAESPEMHSAFDARYGWELHHLLIAIAQGKEPVSREDA